MIMFMTFIVATHAQQLSVHFDNFLRPSIHGSCDAFLTSQPSLSEKERGKILKFVQYFLYESAKNQVLREMFGQHIEPLTKECWDAWISLVNNGDKSALNLLSRALHKGMYGLESNPIRAQELYEATNKKIQAPVVHTQVLPTQISAISTTQQEKYAFDHVTPSGLVYLKKIVRIEHYLPESIARMAQKLPGMQNNWSWNYTSETKKIAEEWILKMHPPIRDAIVGDFKSLRDYYPSLLSSPRVSHGSDDSIDENETSGLLRQRRGTDKKKIMQEVSVEKKTENTHVKSN